MKHTLRIYTLVILLAFSMSAMPTQFAQAETIRFGWADAEGGVNLDYGVGVALDANGNVYSTGIVNNSPGNQDFFIDKRDGNGNLVWFNGIGGLGGDAGCAITLDANGDVYVAGYYSDTVDFDPGGGTSNLTSAGSSDAFLIKFDNNGNFIWIKGVGGTSSDRGYNVAVDSSGNIYWTGLYSDTVDFDPGPGTSSLTSTGSNDVFVSKFDSSGNFLWAKSMGGVSDDESFGIAIDGSGSVFAIGYFSETADFDPGPGINTLTSAGFSDIFISKLDSNGNFVWARSVGGTSSDNGIEIALDGSNNVYVAGYFGDRVTAGTTNLISAGSEDAFVGKLDGNGNFLWAKGMGGTGYDHAYGIALDDNSDVYVTGGFSGTADFDPGTGTSNLISTGFDDIFISKLDVEGNFIWAKGLGGTSSDGGDGIAVDGSNLYLTGYFSDTVDFDPGAGTNNLTSAGGLDIFISKLTLTPQIYVKWDAIGANDGSSWADAFTDLQSALAAASSGDEIWVAAGTYRPTAGTDRTVSFQFKNGVAVYGGFAGTETMRAQRDPATNVTILSGDIGTADDKSDNSYHVVLGSNTDTLTRLDGFTITAGNASGTSPNNIGGGIYINNNGNLAIRNVIISDNSNSGMYNDGSPSLTNVTFMNNAAGQGGGLFNDGSLHLTDVTFMNNTAGQGGGLFNLSRNDSSTLINVTFRNNIATGQGGGIYNRYGDFNLANVSFIENAAALGGGIFNDNGTFDLRTVDFANNNASAYGGGMVSQSGASNLIDVTFTNNTGRQGGGIANLGSRLTLTDVSFTGNTATETGGGIYGSGSYSSLLLTNATLNANHADTGAGIYVVGGAELSVQNTLLENNIAVSEGGGIYVNTGSSPSFTNITLRGNEAQLGGGMYIRSGDRLSIQAAAFENNTASEGGGVYSYNSRDMSLTNVTFTGNHGSGLQNFNSLNSLLRNVTFAGNPGAGIYNSGSNLQIRNVILWGNGVPINNDYGSTSTVSDSVVQGGCPARSTCTNIIIADPKLGSLGNYGGSTQTISLLPGSSAIDAGNDTYCPATDQRGMPRPQGNHCDIGAFESQYAVRYVKRDATGANNGSSWADAFTDLQSALAAASSGDEIWVAAGVYKPGTNRTDTFQLKDGVAVYGGFAGTETARDQRNIAANVTILSGDIDNNDDSNNADGNFIDETYADIVGSNSYHVVTGASGATLDGFTITAGYAFATATVPSGGGVYNYYSSPTVTNVTFIGNLADVHGGGMYNRYSSPIVTNITFSSNSAFSGGGMYNEYSNPAVTNITFGSNSATHGGGMTNSNSSPTITNVIFSSNSATHGGGMANSNSSPTITNVTFSSNTAATYGGGMYNEGDSSPTITNVTFGGNSAANSGGGMYNYQSLSKPIITNVTFSNNLAVQNGGGMENYSGRPTFMNVTFSGNQAQRGGGIYNYYSSMRITNATFSGNSVTGSGGGMYNQESNPTITNVTFSGNSATISGGGMYNQQTYNNDTGRPTLKNVILANSVGGDCALAASSTLNAASSNNLIEDIGAIACNLTNGANGNIIGSDPLLGTLGNYGGSTQTLPLLSGSPAINVGTDSVSICDSDTSDNFDQRGMTRPQGTHCDIGAYEVQIGSFRSRTSGTWNSPTTWEISTNGGATWSPALDYPSAVSGTIHIQNRHTVTVTESIPVDEVTIDTGGQVTINSGVTFSIADGASTDLAISGSLLNQGTISVSPGAAWTAAAGGTYIHNTTSAISDTLDRATLDATSNFVYRGSSTLNPQPSLAGRTYGNLSFESTSGLWSRTPTGSNALTVQGNLSIGATGAGTVSLNPGGSYTGPISISKDIQIGAGSVLTVTTNAINAAGNWNNSGTFMPGTGTVVFNGTSPQTIGGSASTTFNNLTVNNSNGILLGAGVTVNNVLVFANGKITTGTNVLAIGPSGSVSGAGDGKYVYGFLRKTVSTGNPSVTYEIGGTSNYAPINVAFDNVSAGGTLTGSTTDGKHPNFDGVDPSGSGLDGSNYINRYWTLTQSGLAFTSYNATFNFTAADYVGSPNPGAMIVRKYDPPNWSHAATNTATATSATGTGFTSFSDFAVGNDSGTTPITLSFFSAAREGNGTTFTWSTATESGNLGFNLYAGENNRLQRLNAEVIPSQKVDSLEQLDYSYQATTAAKIFYIEEVDIHGQTDLHGPFGLGKTYGGRMDESRVTWATVRGEVRQKFIEQQNAVKQHMNVPPVLQDGTQNFPRASDLQLQNTVCLKVNRTGIYRITYEMLKTAGLDLAGVPASKITVTNRGEVVPIYVQARALNWTPKFGPGDYFEFYGEALDTLYTDTNIYVVQVKRSAAAHIANIRTPPGRMNKIAVSFRDTLVVNKQNAYANYAPGKDPWYDREMLVFTDPKSWDIAFDAAGLNPGTAAALDLTVWGVTDWPQSNDHHMQVSVNGSRLADETFDGLVEQRLHLELPAGLLREGANTLTITLPGDAGVEAELITFDKLSVTYQRTFTAQDGRLTFTASEKVYKVTNLPTKNVVVYRKDATGIVRLGSVRVSASGNSFTATFAGTSQPATYLVSAVESLYAPVLEASKQVVDLNHRAQYLIIAHPNFIPGLQPLIQARQAQGLTVDVVNVDDLYTQYSYGVFDPSAIQKYIAYATKNLGTQYVLLVGGDTYDYRNYLGINSVSFIPSLYTQTGDIANFVPSDPLYADVNADKIPDVAIGRFPVRTVAELDTLVAKTLAYASKDYGKTAVFASDKNDGALSFQTISNQLASTLPDDWSVASLHLDALSVKDARLQLISAMNAGQALVTFTGHSDPQSWTFSNLFTLNDTKTLTNSGRPFVVIQWGCWNNYYVDPVYNYLVQGFLFNGDRGAAATLGATTLANADSEQLLGELLTPRLATPGMTVGDALQTSKAELAQTHPEFLDVILGWSLMGDPALKIDP